MLFTYGTYIFDLNVNKMNFTTMEKNFDQKFTFFFLGSTVLFLLNVYFYESYKNLNISLALNFNIYF